MKPLKWIAPLLISGALYAACSTIEQKTPAGSGGVTPTSSTTLANKTIDDASNTLTGVYASASILRARDYGILPTNSASTNDTGFAALKAKMQTSSTTVWRVIFEPGAYTYTNNRWLYGVNNAIVEGYGSTFQNATTDMSTNAAPLWNGYAFDSRGDPAGATSYVNGYVFNTASAGATSITTTTAADAGNFSPGNRVLLGGYDQQGHGWPPNYRYFEYRIVLTANASTGVVTFTNALENYYDSRWWDIANYGGLGLAFGAPRILNLSRTDYTMPALVWLKGMTFLQDATSTSGLFTTGDLVIFEDVSYRYMAPTITNRFICRRCISMGVGVEPDKELSSAVIEDSIVNSIGQAWGVNNLSIIRTKVLGSNISVNSRHLVISDSDITPAANGFGGIQTANAFGTPPLKTVSISNTRIHNTGQIYGVTDIASPGESLTVRSVSGTDILLAFDTTVQKVAHSIDYGMTITNKVTGNSGVITGIWYDSGSPGNLHITGTWKTPTAGDVFYYSDVIEKYDGGGNVIVGKQIPFWRSPPALSMPSGNTGTLRSPRDVPPH